LNGKDYSTDGRELQTHSCKNNMKETKKSGGLRHLIVVLVIFIISLYSYNSYKIKNGFSYFASNSYIFRICKFDLERKKISFIVTACRSEVYNQECYYAIEGKKRYEFDLFVKSKEFYIITDQKTIPIYRGFNRTLKIPYQDLCLLMLGKKVCNQEYAEFKYTKYL
jgi:hypothetical protein